MELYQVLDQKNPLFEEEKITTAIPDVKPTVTGYGIYFSKTPNRKKPIAKSKKAAMQGCKSQTFIAMFLHDGINYDDKSAGWSTYLNSTSP